MAPQAGTEDDMCRSLYLQIKSPYYGRYSVECAFCGDVHFGLGRALLLSRSCVK